MIAPPVRAVGSCLLAVLLAASFLAADARASAEVPIGAPVADPAGVKQTAHAGFGLPLDPAAGPLALRVADVDGGPPWGLRVIKTTRRYGCVQVGRVVGGDLGILGADGAFGDDGLLHPLLAAVESGRECLPLDGAGHAFIAVATAGRPASASWEGCVVQRPPANLPFPDPTAGRPLCDQGRLRTVLYGALGPRAVSVTYRDEQGRVKTAKTVGPDGAYLVVHPVSAGSRPTGGFTIGPSPGSGLRSVRYDDGSVCSIRRPDVIGGAKRCPTRGYVAPRFARLRPRDVRARVSARVAPKPVVPEVDSSLAEPPAQWKLTVAFTAPVAARNPAEFVYDMTTTDAVRCRFGQTGGSVMRDVRRGERVKLELYVPTACHGRVTGKVALHRPREPETMPGGFPSPSDLVVGRFGARLPR